jgi:hypothetical protein
MCGTIKPEFEIIKIQLDVSVGAIRWKINKNHAGAKVI